MDATSAAPPRAAHKEDGLSSAPDRIRGDVHEPAVHDSATLHVTGRALYTDDLPEPSGCLHLALGLAQRAHARIRALDLAEVRASPGVVLVLTAEDLGARNDISPVHAHDEPLLAAEEVAYFGQPLFVVAAETREQARIAVRRARVEYEDRPALLTIEDARAAGGALVCEPLRLERGPVEAALAAAPHRLEGRIRIGGQEHFYLEGQIALAIPGIEGEMLVWSSTQHPSETQLMVAQVLGLPMAAIGVRVRRIGGGFGGKETQANLFACLAALVAARTGRPAKLRPDRDEDVLVTGKRHDMLAEYRIGFDPDGRIRAVEAVIAARCGFSADLSGPVTDRALFHADNAYFYPAVRLRSEPLRTHTCSNTAFRGFGGPQGVLVAERIVEEVAFATGLDPLEVRKRNLYREGDLAPYHQPVEGAPLRALIEELEQRCRYAERRAAIRAFNATSPLLKKGLALTPVKFGISFTATWYNQAGALLHVYRDGSVLLAHGGIEMGQGLFVKVAQVVAHELGLDLDRIRLATTDTGKVPNTSATAASSGSDLNGMAAQAAARALKERLARFAAEHWRVPEDRILWLPGRLLVGNREIAWEELVATAYRARVQLSATGFYRTPEIHWDRKAGRGRPFYYFACGAACAEVTIDTLTGEYRIDRVDVLHDCGRSLNPAVDIGQIEGGLVQGIGWLTTEELVWDEAGRLRTHAPSTYKIPTAGDRPRVLNVALYEGAPNHKPTIHRSKAVGEPPLMLATAVLHALSDAIASTADHRICPRLDPPATPEAVRRAIRRLRAAARASTGP
ncbi:MAG: xanthine dehydrogenase molybdopterin binding subunit [Geminicoccaceae bacterium]|nr:xanthine dehydrogenase molybdopterin binding subunit [Geminicoccaceae bacterium]